MAAVRQRSEPVTTIHAFLARPQRRQEWTVSRWTEGLESPTSAAAADGPGRNRHPAGVSIDETRAILASHYGVYN